MSYSTISMGLCRVCLSHSSGSTVPLLSGTQHTPMATALCRLAPAVRISSTDMLPKQICMECVIQVIRSERFRRKAETTHAKLTAIASAAEPGDVHEDIVSYSMYKHYFPDDQPALVMIHSQARIVDPSGISGVLQSKQKEQNWPDDMSQTDEPSQDMVQTVPPTRSLPRRDRVPKKRKIRVSHSRSGQGVKSEHTTRRSVAAARGTGCGLPTRETSGGLPTRSALVTCRVCDKRLLRMSYRAHLKRHYAPEFVCEHCGADFYTRGELASHLAFTHNAGRGFVCDHCGQVFRTKLTLREHLFRHDGVRPYACPHCPRTFYSKQVSANHAKRHNPTRNYKCERCPRAFFTSAELCAHSNSVHERRHLYRCTHCPTTYAKIATVRAHLTAAHGVPREQQVRLARVPPSQQS